MGTNGRSIATVGESAAELTQHSIRVDTAPMQLIDEHNAAAYLRGQGLIEQNEAVSIRELPGGVSNVVLYVERPEADDFVLKQAREQLRVADPWFCSVERIWREVAVLEVCEQLLPGRSHGVVPATTPRVLFTDRARYLYAMTAVPAHVTWKQQLLDGETDVAKAIACGQLLGRLHAGTWGGQELPEELSDRQFFDDLRIDPYYRHVASAHPDLKPAIDGLIDSVFAHQLCLVHGDFSPKNLLVHDGGLVLVDFEVGHFGDPAFDLGFFLTHLFLKAFHAVPRQEAYLALVENFWQTYSDELHRRVPDEGFRSLEDRAVMNLAGCMLARIDGKSKVEYLSESDRDVVRRLSKALLLRHPSTFDAVTSQARSLMTDN